MEFLLPLCHCAVSCYTDTLTRDFTRFCLSAFIPRFDTTAFPVVITELYSHEYIRLTRLLLGLKHYLSHGNEYKISSSSTLWIMSNRETTVL